MKRCAILVCALAALAGTVGPAMGQPKAAAPAFSDEAVEAAISKGVEFFLKTQNGRGHWGEGGAFGNATGESAFVIYALLAAGENPQSAPLAKALKWLASAETKGTYALGIRSNVWHLANRTTLGKYRPQLKKDATVLVKRPVNGAYGYTGKGPQFGTKARDLSNTQYGVLGVWAAAADGLEIPSSYWPPVIKCFEGGLLADGGWGYYPRPGSGFGYGPGGTSTMTMTAAGIASLYVCYDYSGLADDNPGVRFKQVESGLGWFEKNFKINIGGFTLYNIYGIERVALASGYKFFGEHDWYKEGAEYLLKTQAADGSWSWNAKWGGKNVGTAYALLFLVRGRHPVLFNKLQHGGDWDYRTRDMAAVTQWTSRNFETTVNWQIVRTDNKIEDWHDASILYITGTTDPKLTDEELAKIKLFVLRGGMIFTVLQKDSRTFRNRMLAYYKQMFPEYQLTACGPKHPIYSMYFTIDKRSRFSEISNGARPLVVHCDEDLAKEWMARRALVAAEHREFKLAFNVALYGVDRVSALPPRGRVYWPKAAEAGERTVEVVRVKHAGNWDPEPLAWEHFAGMMSARHKVKIQVTAPIALDDLATSGKRVAVMTGAGKAALTDAEAAAVRKYVASGGTLIIDAAGGNAAFAASVRQLLRRALPEPAYALGRLPKSSDIYTIEGMRIDRTRFRRQTGMYLRDRDPHLQAVLVGKRPAVIFSEMDLTCGLAGVRSGAVHGYDPSTAFVLMRNAVLYAASVKAAPVDIGEAPKPGIDPVTPGGDPDDEF